jgi:hypothetical protein
MGTEDLTDMKINVAVLQERYDTICERLTEGKAKMDAIDAKFDEVLQTMRNDATHRRIMGRVWTAGRHIGTIIIAVVVAKIFHEPLSLP